VSCREWLLALPPLLLSHHLLFVGFSLSFSSLHHFIKGFHVFILLSRSASNLCCLLFMFILISARRSSTVFPPVRRVRARPAFPLFVASFAPFS
jgi:hypothetical protein